MSNETPLGTIEYPERRSTRWFTKDEDGLELWLEQVELLGIPTYATFADVPDPTETNSSTFGGTEQNQLVGVAADKTVYRSNGSDWVAFFGHGTENRRLGDVFRESITATQASVESVHTERLSNDTYFVSEFATSGSGTDADPFTDGLQAAFDAADNDGVARPTIVSRATVQLDETVTVPKKFDNGWALFGSGNFNKLYGPPDGPAIYDPHSNAGPFIRGFRVQTQGQNPWIRLDGGDGAVEPWFAWIEFDRCWRSVELDTSDDRIILTRFHMCWFRAATDEPGDWHIYQTSANNAVTNIQLSNCRIWGDLSHDESEGLMNLKNATGMVKLDDNEFTGVGSASQVRIDSSATGPDVMVTDSEIGLNAESADATEPLFDIQQARRFKFSGNNVGGSWGHELANLESVDRFKISDNIFSTSFTESPPLSVNESNLGSPEWSVVDGNDPSLFQGDWGFFDNGEVYDPTTGHITPFGSEPIPADFSYDRVAIAPVRIIVEGGTVDGIWIRDEDNNTINYDTPFDRVVSPPWRFVLQYDDQDPPDVTAIYDSY